MAAQPTPVKKVPIHLQVNEYTIFALNLHFVRSVVEKCKKYQKCIDRGNSN